MDQLSFTALFSGLFLLLTLAFWQCTKRSGDKNTSLAHHAHTPGCATWVIPFLICLMVSLFVYSNTGIGAKVYIEASVLKKEVVSFSLFEFSLVNTITDMYKAKVYFLSVLVLVWSGIWPYLKALLFLIVFYLPKSLLKFGHRRRIIYALDWLGKYALIDLYLMTMLSVAFRFNISTNTIPLVDNIIHDLLTVDILVASKVGLLTFVISTCISLCLNHALLVIHRNAISIDEENDGARGKLMDGRLLNEARQR